MSTTLASLRLTLRRLLDLLVEIDEDLRLRADLGRLDERTLRDVGLSGEQIDAEIRRLPRLGRRVRWRDVGRQIPDETKGRPPDIVT